MPRVVWYNNRRDQWEQVLSGRKRNLREIVSLDARFRRLLFPRCCKHCLVFIRFSRAISSQWVLLLLQLGTGKFCIVQPDHVQLREREKPFRGFYRSNIKSIHFSVPCNDHQQRVATTKKKKESENQQYTHRCVRAATNSFSRIFIFAYSIVVVSRGE